MGITQKNEWEFSLKGGNCRVQAVRDNIIRCSYTKRESWEKKSPIGIDVCPKSIFTVSEEEERIVFQTEGIILEAKCKSGGFVWKDAKNGQVLLKEGRKELTETPLMVYTTGGEEPVIERVQTVDGERNFVQNLKAVQDHMAYHGKLNFFWEPEEQIHGLGQGEEGIYNYRGNVQYLYQHNMRIPIPFLVSDKGYGILVDCGSLMTFNDDCRGSWLYLDMVEPVSYTHLTLPTIRLV